MKSGYGTDMDGDTERLVLRAEDQTDDDSSREPRMWRRLEASLVFDSRQQAPMVGVRTATTSLPRLMFTARGMEIDVQVRPDAEGTGVRLLGQVLNEEFEPTSGRVVVEGTHGSVTADLDECGHFAIDGLKAGQLHLEVHLPDALIVVPSIHT
jgi:hypothetical protein